MVLHPAGIASVLVVLQVMFQVVQFWELTRLYIAHLAKEQLTTG